MYMKKLILPGLVPFSSGSRCC